MRVLIIGAGLGGLCLAHGLHRAGFDVAVYERSTRHGAQPASYGIHLNADGLRALHNCLPPANWDQFTATTVPARNVINFHDPRSGLFATLDFRTPEHATDLITRRRAVTRGNLHDALLAGFADAPEDTVSPSGTPVVHWGKKFTGYTRTPDKRLQVTFEDGSIAIGDLLVGADGSSSRVRGQRHPTLLRRDLGILNVAGRIPLTAELAATLPAELCDTSINNIVPAGPGWLFASTWATGDSSGRHIDGAETTDRYLVWAWAAHRDTYPSHGDNLTGEQLKKHVQDQIRTWSPGLRGLIDATDATDIGPVPLRTMPSLPDWQPDNVTLIGDAIHNMTPMGGIGANTALRDADTLRTSLIAHQRTPADTPNPGPATPGTTAAGILAAVADYEQRMRVYANAALALSTKNAERATNPQRLPRSVFRILLRAADHSTGIKRRIFHTPAETVPVATR